MITQLSRPKKFEYSGSAPVGRLLALPTRPTSDDELVAGLMVGRESSARLLYDQYAGMVRRVLIQVLGSDHDVEDLTQEAIITVIERAHAVRKAQSFRSFVIGVAIHLAKNEIRRRAIRKFVGLGDSVEVPLVEPHDAVMVQGARHLYQVLARIETTARIAFVLRFVQGCDLAETAAACGCSLATVKRKLKRAESQFAALAQADPVLREFLHLGGGQT